MDALVQNCTPRTSVIFSNQYHPPKINNKKIKISFLDQVHLGTTSHSVYFWRLTMLLGMLEAQKPCPEEIGLTLLNPETYLSTSFFHEHL